jgi:alpha-galactosidase/6-phospho-beta-glucosidase family protein
MTPLKLAYIGGGSLFVPSIVNGIAQALRESAVPFAVELALYDIAPERAARMADYARVVARAWDVPIHASLPPTRDAALDGAGVVMVSVWLHGEHARIDRLWQELGFELPEEGPAAVAWAVACAPWSLAVAADMRRLCPGALFVTLMNPTDIITGIAGEAGGVRAAGLCVEVDGLRGALAYYFDVPYESIALTHAGVNHDGWVLDLRVDGQDGYVLWADRWDEIQRDPDFHPGNRGIPATMALMGRLRSSGYHHWPLEIAQSPAESARWSAWRSKRETFEAAVTEALRSGTPITDPPGIHPERSALNYPYTGLAVGRLLRAIATGAPEVLPLQVPNAGAIANFPPKAIVEVPVQVHGSTLIPQPVGELPEWLGGTTRLLAIQRRLVIDYLLDRELMTLKRALATLPLFGTVQQLTRFAESVHRHLR